MKKKLLFGAGVALFALVVAVCVNLNRTPLAPQPAEVSKAESLDELVKQFNPVETVEAYAQDTIM